jgi:glycosyltransferase involved in cell wall biosynthesis
MRIGHYAPQLWAPGGIASYVRRLGAALQARGHEVFYYSRLAPPGSPPTQVVDADAALFAAAARDGLDVLHLHKPVDTLPDDRVPTLRTMHGNQGGCPSGSRYLERTGRPCPRAYSPLGCIWGHLVDHCGSRRPGEIWANLQNVEHEQRLAAALPTLTVSAFVRDAMVASGCAPDRLTVLRSPAPADDTPFRPPPADGAPRVAFLGRLVPHKGVGWLIEAAAQVPGLQVDVAGTGTDAFERHLRALAERLDVRDRVRFHGWLGPEDSRALMLNARAVAVPSTWHEPAGLVTLEAAAVGRAVVASEVGGIPEYARPEFARLAPPRDTAALAAHLHALATDYDHAATLGRQGYALVRSDRFSMAAFLDRLEAIYGRVAARAPLPTP